MASTGPVNMGGTPYKLGMKTISKGKSPSQIKLPHVYRRNSV